MIIGVPKEIKNNENRVAMTPAMVKELTNTKHSVYLENGAGQKAGFTDEDYQKAGAIIVSTAKEAWSKQLVIKVKEPLKEEYQYFYEGLILFTYLHLAANEELTKELITKKVTAFAYETVFDNGLPLLRPMSEIAGKRAVIVGASLLESINGGKGIVLSGLPGVKKAKVVILGGGIAGLNAAKYAMGLGADVSIIELDENRLRFLEETFQGKIQILKSNEDIIFNEIKTADLVISTILIPGSKAPKIVKKYMVKAMPKQSVIIDVAIDQGGSVETITHATTHDEPTFVKYDVIHYSVGNMPGAVAKAATEGLTNATFKYIKLLAKDGVEENIKTNHGLRSGLNTYNGKCYIKEVCKLFNLEYENI